MSELYQSTYKVPDSINPESLVLERGEITVSLSDIGGGVWAGDGVVDLNLVKKQVVNPDVLVYRFVDAGAPSYNRTLIKCPYHDPSLTVPTVGHSLFWSQGDDLSLVINVRSTTSASLKFYYVISTLSVVKDDVLSPIPPP